MAVNPQSPGVFVQEIPAAPPGIAGVSTSEGGFVGFSQKGLENTAVRATSFDIWQRFFGSETSLSPTPTAVRAFFDEGGQILSFVRVLPADAVLAEGSVLKDDSITAFAVAAAPVGTTIVGTPLATAPAFQPIVPGTIIIKVGGAEAGRDDGVGGFFGSGTAAKQVLSGTIDYITGAITLTFDTALTGAADILTADFYNYVTLVATVERWHIKAKGRGDWGNNIKVQITPNVGSSAVIAGTQFTPIPNGVVDTFTVTVPLAQRPILPGSVLIKVDGLQAGTDVPPPDSSSVAKLASNGASTDLIDTASASSFVNYEAGTVSVKFTANVAANKLITVDFTQLNRFDVTVLEQDPTTGVFGVSEQFQALDFTDSTSPNYVKTVIGGDEVTVGATTYLAQPGTSNIIKWEEGANFPVTPGLVPPDNVIPAAFDRGLVEMVEFPIGDTDYGSFSVEGDDGTVTGSGLIDLKRIDVTHPSLDVPNDEKGMYVFKKVPQILNLVIPDLVGSHLSALEEALVIRDEVQFAVNQTNRFVIAVVPLGLNATQASTWKVGTLDPLITGINSPSIPAKFSRSFLAVYFPHLKVVDTNTGMLVTVTPIGHIAGIYARTDSTRNVGKAPAGVNDGAIQTAVDIDQTLTLSDKDLLTQAHINVIQNEPSTGLCVFGARTMFFPSGPNDPDIPFQYINARRLFMFVEQSVKEALFVYVFENNGPQLWAKVRALISGFLLDLFNRGFFAGRTAAEAFSVVCDDSNNSTSDINNGRLNVLIKLAPNRPAEFIVLTFQQQVLAG
jgi:phage tail sheath protein FI